MYLSNINFFRKSHISG